jgi:hypothetical protein
MGLVGFHAQPSSAAVRRFLEGHFSRAGQTTVTELVVAELR